MARDGPRVPVGSVCRGGQMLAIANRSGPAHPAYERMEATRYEARARYSSIASAGTWAMPSTITYLILRSWMRTRSSRVEMPSRRAASLARRGSADIGPSLGVVEAQFTTEDPDLRFDAHHLGQVAAVNEAVPGVFQRSEQSQRLVQAVGERFRRPSCVRRGRRRFRSCRTINSMIDL